MILSISAFNIPKPNLIVKPANIAAEYAHKRAAKKSYYYFATNCCGHKPADFHLKCINLIEDSIASVVKLPRGHAKTTMISVIYTLWKTYENEGYESSIVSYSEKQGKRILREIKNLLKLPHFERDTIKVDNKTELEFKNGSRVEVAGFGSGLRGPHPHLLICDDILNDRSGITPDNIREIFWSALWGQRIPKTKFVVVGTPLYFNDVSNQEVSNL